MHSHKLLKSFIAYFSLTNAIITRAMNTTTISIARIIILLLIIEIITKSWTLFSEKIVLGSSMVQHLTITLTTLAPNANPDFDRQPTVSAATEKAIKIMRWEEL